MAAKIWDSAQGAFVDAATPQVYDSSAGAYKDSTGLVWDSSAGAWEKAWNDALYLYQDGALNTLVAGDFLNTGYGWNGYSSTSNGYSPSALQFVQKSNSFYLAQTRVAGVGTLFFTNPVDVTFYNKINVECTFSGTGIGFGLVNSIVNNYKVVTNTGPFIQKYLDISELEGKYYMFFSLYKSYAESSLGIYIDVTSIALTK